MKIVIKKIQKQLYDFLSSLNNNKKNRKIQPTLNKKQKKVYLDAAMLLMQCIGIIAVVFGHADLGGENIPNFLNLAFPYYSWHMPFFIFISGYFFNRKDKAGKYIIKKVKKHLLPAMIVNLICGVFSMCIKHFGIASYGQDITLESLFVTPFTTGYQFYINVSLWFVFALFIIEVIACIMDRLTRSKADIIFLVLTLATSFYCCYKSYYDFLGTRGEFINAFLRLGYLMFFFWLGVCYKKYAEKFFKKVLNFKTSIVIFLIIATILGYTNYAITINVRDMKLIPITVPNGFWVAIVSPIVAIMFFLGISYSLAPYFKNNKVLTLIGSGTRYVMYYHQLIFVLFSLVLGGLINKSILKLESFSFEKMSNSAYYTGGNVAITCVVAIISLILPILLCNWISRQKKWISFIIYAVLTIVIIFLLYGVSLLMRT